jgi:secondary thiamine-phosphate synthase enzyme
VKKTLNIQTDHHVQLKEVTFEIKEAIKESGIIDGMAILFVPHTTAAITINENADPDVAIDMVYGLNNLVPLSDNYKHLEGNSAAHIKCSLIGASEQLIINQGKLLLGTWQGIYFCEFDGPRSRSLHIKIVEN